MLEKWLSSTICKFFEKCPNTSKKSHAHFQCVHNNCVRFEECQLKGVGGVGAHPPTHPPDIHHSVSPMHFVQPSQISLQDTLGIHVSSSKIKLKSCINRSPTHRENAKWNLFGWHVSTKDSRHQNNLYGKYFTEVKISEPLPWDAGVVYSKIVKRS
jgi:hypothetical protein